MKGRYDRDCAAGRGGGVGAEVFMTDLDWFVYIVENERGALYTGVTNSIARRMRDHATSSRGASFFRFAAPRRLVYTEIAVNRSAALKREVEIKRLRRTAKLALIAAQRAASP